MNNVKLEVCSKERGHRYILDDIWNLDELDQIIDFALTVKVYRDKLDYDVNMIKL